MAFTTSQGTKLSECVTYTINSRSELRTGDKVPFNTIYNKTEKNDSFKLDGNDILFLKKCKVLVSATLPFHLNGTTAWLRFAKNNDTISTLIVNIPSEEYQTLSLSPKLLSVDEGDRLYIGVVNTTNYIMIGANLSNTEAVYLTVQKID